MPLRKLFASIYLSYSPPQSAAPLPTSTLFQFGMRKDSRGVLPSSRRRYSNRHFRLLLHNILFASVSYYLNAHLGGSHEGELPLIIKSSNKT